MNDKVLALTLDNWEAEVTGSTQPVLVDFWAEWCAPCRMIAPVIAALTEEFAGRVKFGKLNVDEHDALAVRYDIRSIPALLLFRGGRVIDQRLGALPREELKRFLEANLSREGSAVHAES